MSETLIAKDAHKDIAANEHASSTTAFTPRFDIWESDDEIRLLGDLPGVTADDLHIRFEDRELLVHGKVAPRHGDVDELYSEYEIGDFYRTFTVGESIDTEKITAELKNGVVIIHLPKTEKVKPRRIEVTSGE